MNAMTRPLSARPRPPVSRRRTLWMIWKLNSPTATTPAMAAVIPSSSPKPFPPRCTALALFTWPHSHPHCVVGCLAETLCDRVEGVAGGMFSPHRWRNCRNWRG